MILGKPAFHVNDLVESGDRAEAMDLCAADGAGMLGVMARTGLVR